MESVELEALKQRVQHMRPDLPMTQVLGYLIRRWKGLDTRYAPTEASEALGITRVDSFASFLLLQGEPLFVLNGQWVYLDGAKELPIADEVLVKTMLDEEFYHPETGELVLDYMQTIHLIYSAGETLNRLMSGVYSLS